MRAAAAQRFANVVKRRAKKNQTPSNHASAYNTNMSEPIAIVGAGPAGLMAAQVLARRNLRVAVYDALPSPARKFLMAGRGGLNLTHSEPFEIFVTRYGARRAYLEPLLQEFGPAQVRAWADALGAETFVGTSGRVFPRAMKASPLLRAWLKQLNDAGVTLHARHKWRGFAKQNAHEKSIALIFDTPDGEKIIRARAVILALGGGSWAKLGSDGAWVSILEQCDIPIQPLRPANCGFVVAWSDVFRKRFEGAPVKSVTLTFKNFSQQGEFVITRAGIEGSLVYAASALLRDALETNGSASIALDLAPQRSQEWLAQKLKTPRGKRSLTTHLEKTIGMHGAKSGLLREFVPRADFDDAKKLAARIKHLRVPLIAPAPLDRAISSAGGVPFEALDENLMLRNLPGVFCAGEMLDWEAPTGGYLLTACFATGRVAGLGVVKWLMRT